jgi:GTP cyclohydrolase I
MAKITKEQAEQHIRDLFEYIGEDPNREGLKGSPERIVRMWKEIFRGYDPAQKPKITCFPNGQDGLTVDQMVTDTGDFQSNCEHHGLWFYGKYYFAYIPNPKGKILGLSKIARVVDYCGARLQIQERLVSDVVNMITEALGEENPPLGIALVMKAHHTCKELRGAKKKGLMSSAYLTGLFKTDEQARQEFYEFVNNNRIE